MSHHTPPCSSAEEPTPPSSPTEPLLLPPHLFPEVVEQAPIAVSITDQRANILYINRAFELLTGYPRGEIQGRNQSLLANGTTPTTVYQQLWQTIRKKQLWRGVLVNRRKDGSEYLADLTIAPLLDGNGKIRHYLGMHRDISEQHQLESRHSRQQSLLTSVLDAAPAMVLLLDTQQRVILHNAHYTRLQREFGEAHPFPLIREALLLQTGIDLESACREGKSFSNREIRLDILPGEPRWYSCSGSWVCELEDPISDYYTPAPDAADTTCRPCLLLLANEISDRKRELERTRIQQLRAALAEQQLALVMRETLEAAVFQLQGPLNLIDAALRMLDHGVADPATLENMLHEILTAGRATLHQMESALPDPIREAENHVNLNELLQEVVQLSAERLLRSGIVIDWRPQPVLPALTGRHRELRALLMNLLENAINALEQANIVQREIRLTTRHLDELLIVEVIDNGIGVAEGIASRIFEPFFSGWQPRQRHTGMGLTLAREIAAQHGGGVYLDHDFLGGCRMRAELAISPLHRN